MKPIRPTYQPYGEAALLVQWPPEMKENRLRQIIAFKAKIEPTRNVFEVVQSIHSLLVIYNSEKVNYQSLVLELKQLEKGLMAEDHMSARHCWHIPVCYHSQFGLDLKVIAAQNHMSISEVIQRHTHKSYTVYAIGFLPGFLYLGGLDERLHTERKATPRREVLKGAVGIGGKQTGVYPATSPGGWQIIGATPITFFDTKLSPPCFANPGDQIQFFSISLKEYEEIKHRYDAGTYLLKKEVIDA